MDPLSGIAGLRVSGMSDWFRRVTGRPFVRLTIACEQLVAVSPFSVGRLSQLT
jgi:hypothetical protein